MIAQTIQPMAGIAIRDTLFGDLSLKKWGSVAVDELPWTLFKSAKEFDEDGEDAPAVQELQEVLALPALETRHYLQAHHFLKKMYAVKSDNFKLYGVVLEIAMEQGHDILAVYEDHSARYYNYAGGAVIIDTAIDKVSEQIEVILQLGREILPNIGPWKYDRPDAPKKEFARINFLTSAGLHFGEAHQAVLFKDPMASAIISAMYSLLETMIDLTSDK